MKLLYALSHANGKRHANFGDELNAWLWPRLLPGFFDDNEDELFLGIGSILGQKRPDDLPYREGQKRIVFGSGFVPSYQAQPDVSGKDWDVFFVRGPRTARTLNLPPEKSIGDSAILLRAVVDYATPRPKGPIGFMPHWGSLEPGNWEEVCQQAGLRMLNPNSPVETVLEEILSCPLLITEAMHGAIVADALRIPWIAVLPLDAAHRDKWFDWAEALDIRLKPSTLRPSTLAEVKPPGRGIVARIIRHGARFLKRTPLAKPLNAALTARSAERLRRLARQAPSLSTEEAITRATARMEEQLDLLKRTYGQRNR